MIMNSKAQTLNKLSKFNEFNIPKLKVYKVGFFLKSKIKILEDIKLNFKGKIALRSSNVFEDKKTTKAGMFKSYLNINPKNLNDVNNKILQIIKSYKNYESKNNEFFIQEMAKETIYSGVCFTQNIEENTPEWKINFTKNQDTTLVTSGRSIVRNINFFETKKIDFRNKAFRKLYLIIKKLQKKTKIEALDVEFAISKKNKISILQVRELPNLNKRKNNFEKKKFFLKYKNLEKKIIKLKKKNPNQLGKTTFFGTMPDWNPAEIIGTKPLPLSLSLYQELITNNVWADNRKNYGYRNVSDSHLMTTFYGTPYIDIRTDFNSWIPKDLDEKLSEKLVNYYLINFKKKSHFHDKVEFEILFTCFNFETKKRVNKLLKNFTSKEKKLIISSLKKITKLTINNTKNELKLINRLKIKQNIIKNKNLYWLDKIFWLIQDCKKLGTASFAGLARAGFVSIDILNSMVNEKIITNNDKNKFLNSINTVLGDLKKDHLSLNKNNFLSKYGHLRPNTYEISSKNYKEGYSLYFKNKSNHGQELIKKQQFKITNEKSAKINIFLKKNNFDLDCKKLFSWMKNSIESREYSKFIFTKSIDLIFDYIKKFGKRNSIKIEDLSYLKINELLNFYYNLELGTIENKLKKSIKLNRNDYQSISKIKLPNIILSHKEIYYKEDDKVKINFIGSKISGELIELTNFKKINLKNKIVCIENADPGYDFIFSHNIKGLITKYGGANSHMAIRCYELNVSAAIGLGEELFNKIKKLEFITIDSNSQNIY